MRDVSLEVPLRFLASRPSNSNHELQLLVLDPFLKLYQLHLQPTQFFFIENPRRHESHFVWQSLIRFPVGPSGLWTWWFRAPVAPAFHSCPRKCLLRADYPRLNYL